MLETQGETFPCPGGRPRGDAVQLPDTIPDEKALEEVLTHPSDALVDNVRGLSGSIVILGIGGKMGTTVGVRLKRALELAGSPAKVIGVSRFSNPDARTELEKAGIETAAADLLVPEQVESLPYADRVVYLAGRKFGTTGHEPDTWAMNTLPPIAIVRRYAGVPIVAYSTGAVYDMVPVTSGGATEETPLEPRGEYANAAVARERLFEWAAREFDTPICLIRLFYANDLRYGVLRDLADSVMEGREIDITMGSASLIWQGDAADQSLRAFEYATNPPTALNVTGPETVSIEAVARRMGELLGRDPVLTGEASSMTLLGNASKALGLFGYPEVPLDRMIRWTAAWAQAGGRSLGKPTHWEVRDGRY